jgi:hypothetical protein
MRRDSHEHYLISRMLSKEPKGKDCSREFKELCRANGAITDLEVKELVEKHRKRYPWLYNMWKESYVRPVYRFDHAIGGWKRRV